MNDTNTKEEEVMDEALSRMPDEVQNFMWSEAYEILLTAMQTTIGLSDAQKEKVRLESYDLLLGIKDMTAIAQELLKEMPPEHVSKILYFLDSEIVTRAENLTEFYTPEEETTELKKESDIIQPVDVFDSLKNKFTKTTVIAPTSRLHESSPETVLKKEENRTPPRIDPYRELPQ